MLYLINGPPRSGKDTLTAILRDCLGPDSEHWKFSDALKKATHGLYGMTQVGTRGWPLPPDYFEECKDSFTPGFLGSTPRQAYIDVHEKYLKPIHGDDILGKMLISSLMDSACYPEHAVISDVGNHAQCQPVLMAWEGSVTLIHLERPGVTWTDNRVTVQLKGVRSLTLFNPGTSVEEFRTIVLEALPELSPSSVESAGS